MLTLDGVTKRFGQVTALEGVTLSLAPGELTCIVGDSGSGKTTFLQLLGGMEPPTEGKICLDGEDVWGNADAYRADHIGFIYQDFNLIAGLSVRENATLGASLCGRTIPPGEAEECLARVGLPRQNQPAETLSGGEKQRVAAARALLKNADVILADEPTGNLDPENADKMFSLLREICPGRHIVAVTHDRERAERYGDRVIFLQKGRVTEDRRICREAEPAAKQVPPSGLPRAIGKCRRPVGLLARNSFRRRWLRMLLVALVLALASATLAAAWEMRTLGNQVEESVNYRYLETDLVSVQRDTRDAIISFTEEETADLVAGYGAVGAVGSFVHLLPYSFSAGQRFATNVTLKPVHLNDFFRDRVMSNEIEGRFPENERDVILALDTASQLGASVGSNVTLQNGTGQTVILAVVGINRTVNPEGKIYSFVSEEAIRDLANKSAKAAFADGALVMGGVIGKGTLSTVTGEEELVYGRAPATPNEAIVSLNALTTVIHPDLPICSYETAAAGNAPQELLDRVIGVAESIHSHSSISRPVTVVGIFRATEEEKLLYGNDIRMTAEGRAALSVAYPDALDLYFDGSDAAQSAQKRLTKEGFRADSMLETLQERVENWTMLWGVAVTAIGVVLAVILTVLLFVFVKLLISERRYEIAVLRSLGAGRRFVSAVVLCDFLAVYLLAVAFSAAFAALYPAVFSIQLAELTYIRARYPILPLFAVDAAFLPICLCFAVISLVQMLRVSPAVLLRQSE